MSVGKSQAVHDSGRGCASGSAAWLETPPTLGRADGAVVRQIAARTLPEICGKRARTPQRLSRSSRWHSGTVGPNAAHVGAPTLTRLAQLSRGSRATTAPATLSRRRERGRGKDRFLKASVEQRFGELDRSNALSSFWFPFPQGKGRGVRSLRSRTLAWLALWRRCALGAAFEDRSAWHSTTGGPNAAHVGAPTLTRLAQLSRGSRATTAPATLSRQRERGPEKIALQKLCGRRVPTSMRAMDQNHFPLSGSPSLKGRG